MERLNDYNCLHFKTDVILGISEPRYDEKWLEEQKKKDTELIEYNGVKKTKYEWQQGARRLECGIRKERDISYMAKASGDKTLERKANEKISIYRKGYDDLCDKVGLEKRYNRMATFPAKSVDNVVESGIIKSEMEHSPRKMSKGNYAVDWEKVQSKEYTRRLSVLSDNPNVVSAIETRAKWALNNRNGVDTEEIYAISLKDGREIGRITHQDTAFGIMRTPEFAEKLNIADDLGDNILLIHNHPRGLPASIGDLNVLVKNKNISGITVGHDGSIYYYTRPNKEISEFDYNVKLRHLKQYDEVTGIEKALESLQEQYGFIIKKL